MASLRTRSTLSQPCVVVRNLTSPGILSERNGVRIWHEQYRLHCKSIYIGVQGVMTRNLPLRSRFGIRFSLLARRWRRIIEVQLAEAGLTDATWVPLVHLKETGGGISQKELAALVGVDGSSLVRVLDILEREGMIERRRDETDGRARLIHLTLQGEVRVSAIRKELGRAEEAMLCDLSDEDIANMLQHFETISHLMDRLGTQGRMEENL